MEALNDKIRALRMREQDLTAAIEDQQTSPTPAALAEIRAMLSEGLDDDAPIPRRKAVLNRLIAEIRIESPEAICPTFKLPMEHLRDQTVRPLFRLVEAAGVEPASEAECPGTSTSVSGILLSPRGSSQRDPRRPAAVLVPDRGRGALGPVSRYFVTPLPRLAGRAGGGARALGPGARLYAT